MVMKDLFDLLTLIVIGAIVMGIVSNKNSANLARSVGVTFNNSLKAMKS
jgi:hypothetical protein